MDISNFPPPSTFGMPPKFQRWRPEQLEAIMRCTQTNNRFMLHALPTGSGKSLAGIALAAMNGWRVVYVTSTKGLQRQLQEDFGEIGLVDIRGQNNYRCRLSSAADTSYTGCDHGPCHAGAPCMHFNGGCPYFDQVRQCQKADFVITNYAYWLMANATFFPKKRKGAEFDLLAMRDADFKPKPVDLLVLDECHNAPDELTNAMTFELSRYDTEAVLGLYAPWHTDNVDTWRRWVGNDVKAKIQDEYDKARMEVTAAPMGPARRKFFLLKNLREKFAVLSAVGAEWVADLKNANSRISFAPVWPADFLQVLVPDGVKRVLMMSATVRPKTANMLGLADDQFQFFEYDSSFPISRRRVYHVPTVRMRQSMTEDEYRVWLNRIDQIIKPRLDRKGIIHTVSYDRRNRIVMNSDYNNFMLSHETATANAVVHQFKAARPPSILVSPSVSTGYDFPGDECRYQIIGKLAFVDTSNKIVKARCEKDPDYSAYIAMQELIQAVGRGVRSRDDFCESFIVDDSIKWFLRMHGKAFAPKWFLRSIFRVETIPSVPAIPQ